MNNYNLEGRRAIVTGGAQGFGSQRTIWMD